MRKVFLVSVRYNGKPEVLAFLSRTERDEAYKQLMSRSLLQEDGIEIIVTKGETAVKEGPLPDIQKTLQLEAENGDDLPQPARH